MKNVKAIIFDLDGTLLNTINDITKALNYALVKNGFDQVSVEEAKYLVGSGAKTLCERALNKCVAKTNNQSYSNEDLQNVYNDYMYSYNLWKYNTTVPYQSVVKTLHLLRRSGIKLCVLSNKPERDTIDVINRYFKGEFDIVYGSKENMPLKPDPTALFEIINSLGLTSDECAYVGDSDVDMLTGKNAKMYTVGACYGFRTKKELVASGADVTINSFYDLLKLFVEEKSGILLIDKGYGISSQECITKVKKVIGSTKIGHAGTLDPLATGLLVVLLGDCTKLSNYLLEDDKKYISEITIGIKTNTLDLEGEVIETKEVGNLLDEDDIDNVLNGLIGPIKMEVPIHSAVKVNGKKLYELARENKEAVLPVKDNYIFDIKRISNIENDGKTLKFKFVCHVSKGTYIRKLCEEIGNRLNFPSYMTSLRRVSSGLLDVSNAITLEDLKLDKSLLEKHLISVNEAIKDYPILEVNDYLYNRVINGMPIRIKDEKLSKNNEVFITYKNNLIAIYEKNQDIDYKAKRVWK